MSRLLIHRVKCDVCYTTRAPDLLNNWHKINDKDVCDRCAAIIARANRMELVSGIVAEMPDENTFAELEALMGPGGEG